ncbi:MAG TPA: cysteine dioxygenase family protein [Dongiaceae bacterium]|nr:cysteine dioxygenase family protein [Dongiaceae bacterium]
MRRSFAETFDSLDRLGGRLPLEAILDWFGSHPLTAEELHDYLVFNRDHYVRNLLHTGPSYQALVLCWRNGQRSPIHNHRGSHCGVKVLRGTATETFFERSANGLILPVKSRQVSSGETTASAEADTHQVSNLQADDADLVTLHIYSPALTKMEVFSLDSPLVREWEDPINDPFIDGGGI